MDDSVQAEYLCTLQPFENSVFAQSLLMKRAACRRAGYGQDKTCLYPPHVSVTGFFKATQRQAQELCALTVRELISAAARRRRSGQSGGGWEKEPEGHSVKVKRVISTEGGHVILDVAAPAVAELACTLAEQAASIGLHVRPKDVRHLSIAADRDAKERDGIAKLHEDIDFNCDCGWNLVVSRLLFRSDVETLRTDGTPHLFCDLLRFPVTQALQDPGAFTVAARTLMTSNVNMSIPPEPWKWEAHPWQQPMVEQAVQAEG